MSCEAVINQGNICHETFKKKHKWTTEVYKCYRRLINSINNWSPPLVTKESRHYDVSTNLLALCRARLLLKSEKDTTATLWLFTVPPPTEATQPQCPDVTQQRLTRSATLERPPVETQGTRSECMWSAGNISEFMRLNSSAEIAVRSTTWIMWRHSGKTTPTYHVIRTKDPLQTITAGL